MNTSRRHHFIPKFYLKHFTDEDGMFYIYDVKNNVFKNNGKKFAPRTHFYETNSNTVSFGGELSSFIEESYGSYDCDVAEIYRKITDRSGDFDLTSHEWTLLQYFINILYWRNPSNRKQLEDRIQQANCLKDLHLRLLDAKGGRPVSKEMQTEFLGKLKDDPDFVKYQKLIVPAFTYQEIFTKENDYAHIFRFPFNLPKLVSDNPIIYRYPGKISLHIDEMIFPLTPTQILIRNRFDSLTIHSVVRIYIDMLLLMQAKEYVACTDPSYPISLKEQFHHRFTSVDELRQTLFKFIYQRRNSTTNTTTYL